MRSSCRPHWAHVPHGWHVGALADRYDKLQNEFNKDREKKTRALDLFETPQGQLEKIDKEIEGLLKEVSDICADEAASECDLG